MGILQTDVNGSITEVCGSMETSAVYVVFQPEKRRAYVITSVYFLTSKRGVNPDPDKRSGN